MKALKEIGFGGGCHWCTEAVFQEVPGVQEVRQGYIASEGKAAEYSEAVIVSYFPDKVDAEKLIDIHLHTHNATSNPSFRPKYRSAIYFMDPQDEAPLKGILDSAQKGFKDELVTQVLPFTRFEPSRASIQNYYRKNPDAPFCRRYIAPKLQILENRLQGDD